MKSYYAILYLKSKIRTFKKICLPQVRKAAMAWRNNKEAAHAAYCALGGAAQQEARRDQIINNARTNWELLRFSFYFIHN